MQIFLNETSLHGQYPHQIQFYGALEVFISSIKRIAEIKNNRDVLKSDHFYYFMGIPGIQFETLLKNNHSLAWAFRENLQKVNPKGWQKQQLHQNTSSYEFLKEDYVMTSVAEISERKKQNNELIGFVLNFSESKFGNTSTINIVKDKVDNISVDCNITPEDIEHWLIVNKLVNPKEKYDEKSGIAPADYQTILKDSAVFEKTSYPRNKGRIVYRKKGTTELWVVDSALKHAGARAHLEVFDEKTKKHLGTSLYNEININDKYKKDNRYINLG